jgi:uncharacterized protein (DUF433 family)
MMDAIREAEELLQKMNTSEKAELYRLLAAELDANTLGIDIDPRVAGGEARVVRTRIPVWLLEQARRLGTSDAELLRAYPTLRPADLEHAWAYARKHLTEIDQQILENEAA